MYLTGVCKSCNLRVPVQGELDLKSSCILTASANSVASARRSVLMQCTAALCGFFLFAVCAVFKK